MIIINKLRLGSTFTGIGAWESALKDLGIEYDLQFFSEIDKYSIKSYCAVHNEPESKNIGDITQVNAKELPDIDILVYSPPCQAFSVAGRQLGFEDKRGVLFFDALKIIQEKQPKYALMENVKGLTSKKFENEFKLMLQSLEEAGYNNYLPDNKHKVLNAKDYGMCQNRERVFIVSIRKDVDAGCFKFPEPFKLDLKLKDILEINPAKNHFYNGITLENHIGQLPKDEGNYTGIYGQKKGFTEKNISNTLDANYSKGLGSNQEKNAVLEVKGCSFRTRNYMGQPQQLEVRKDDVSNTVTTVTKDSMVAIVEDFYKNRPVRVYEETAPTLRADRQGLKVVELNDILESDAQPPILHNIYGGFKETEPRIFKEYSPTIRTAAGGGAYP